MNNNFSLQQGNPVLEKKNITRSYANPKNSYLIFIEPALLEQAVIIIFTTRITND